MCPNTSATGTPYVPGPPGYGRLAGLVVGLIVILSVLISIVAVACVAVSTRCGKKGRLHGLRVDPTTGTSPATQLVPVAQPNQTGECEKQGLPD